MWHLGHMLFLKVSALGNTNWRVAGHLRRGRHYGRELMSPPMAIVPKVSLETGHHSQAMRSLKLWLVFTA